MSAIRNTRQNEMTNTPEGRGPSPAGALVEDSPIRQHREANPGGAAPGRVVHCKREEFDVYIGRPSILGNPWRVISEKRRDEAIRAFEDYARQRMAKDGIFRARVAALHGKTLGCWCAPKRCHGEVLLKFAAELNEATPETK